MHRKDNKKPMKALLKKENTSLQQIWGDVTTQKHRHLQDACQDLDAVVKKFHLTLLDLNVFRVSRLLMVFLKSPRLLRYS